MSTKRYVPAVVDERIHAVNPVIAFGRRVREGQLGALPVIFGLVAIFIVFQSINHNYISPSNLVNLSTTVAYIGMLGLGINLVLLLGEIDLSVAQLGGLAASLLGVLLLRNDINPFVAVGLMLLLGIVVGLVQGWFFAVVGIPAFVVTLAGLLAFTGLTLMVLGSQKNLSMSNTFVSDIAGYYFPAGIAYTIGAVVVIVYAGAQIIGTLRRRRAGLTAPSYLGIAIRSVILALGIFAFLFIVNQDFGLALTFTFMAFATIFLDLMLRKTKYGRAIYAVGGNVEAARRAGIQVTWIRISVFMAAGLIAAIFGFMKAGTTTNAGSTLMSPQDLLYAIAAAVIGGTSLFGGRGTAWAPFLGALVVGSVNNGLFLIGFSSDAQLIVTALVLLAAVVLDALSRRSQTRAGRQ